MVMGTTQCTSAVATPIAHKPSHENIKFSYPLLLQYRLPLTNTGIRLENEQRVLGWRYRVSSYNWNSGCEAAGIPVNHIPLRKCSILVNEGGWLMIGDSLSAQWFMSLSATDTPWNATQHLYLNNASSLVRSMELPVGFDLNQTASVYFAEWPSTSKTEIQQVIEKNTD
ncbi:hypothetical protein KEM48_006988 [Puccinia striiformis f. sp. tritici PST-130]|nr:hypothetical protein KEM48_006988 [Puccinia striiformis f. sp. tritici PST-130]